MIEIFARMPLNKLRNLPRLESRYKVGSSGYLAFGFRPHYFMTCDEGGLHGSRLHFWPLLGLGARSDDGGGRSYAGAGSPVRRRAISRFRSGLVRESLSRAFLDAVE